MQFNDYLRLEIEVPTVGLNNLIQNPSGEKGTWGWVTPVANTNMYAYLDAGTQVLEFATSVAQASYFTSEHLPASAGKYVGARFDLYSRGTNVNAKVRFEWYDSNRTYLSSSTQSGAYSALQTHYYSPVVAPANTAYVKVRFDVFNGTGNSLANDWLQVKNVMVSAQASATDFGNIRTNLVPNPSFEVNTTDWAGTAGTIARSTVRAYTGTASLQLTSNGTTGTNTYAAPVAYANAIGGRTYTASAWVYTTVARDLAIGIFSAAATGSGTGTNKNITVPANTWTRITYTQTLASSATRAKPYIGFKYLDTVNGDQMWIDSVMLEETATAGTYFDGSTAAGGGWTYAWTGTAHASSSTATGSTNTYAFVEPVTWQNILGPTLEVTAERSPLDVGLLTIVLGDPLLDPAVNDDVRPGKKVRLRALDSGIWKSLYEGTLTNVYSEYDKALVGGAEVEVKSTLTAADAASTLSQQGEYSGVENISDLPYILEGKGVAWNVNGSGNQVSSATVVSYNENATTLDQVAITRDSNLGYAWVDKENVLKVMDAAQMSNVVTRTFTDVPNDTPTFYNPGFESADTLSLWYKNPAEVSLAVNTEMPRTGTKSLKAYMNGTYAYFDADYTKAGFGTLKPGTRVRANVWIRRNSASAYTGVYLYGFDSTQDSALIAVETVYPAANTWTSVTLEGVVPEGMDRLNVAFEMNGVVGNVMYVDDISFEDLSSEYPSYLPGIDVDFNVESCINHVTVKWMRYDIGNASTTEIDYGPYVNQTSIDEWGPLAQTFKVQGAVESSSAIADFAADILAANATPVIRANSLTMPVRNEDELAAAVALDLYDLVGVEFGNKVDTTYRIKGIKHTITPEKWNVEVSFDADGSVAQPRFVASPPFKGVTETELVGEILMWPKSVAPAGFLSCDGGTFSAAQYPSLASLLGDTYGVHSGDTYYLPNFTGRFPRGATPGSTGGSGTKTIAESNLPAHSHSMAHTHSINHDHAAFTSAAESGHTHAIDHDHGVATTSTNSHTHSVSGTATSAGDHAHTAGTLTADQAGGHTHPVPRKSNVGTGSGYARGNASSEPNDTTNQDGGHTHTVSGSTATTGAHTHPVSGTAANVDHSHTVDLPNFTGSSGGSSGHSHNIDVPAFTGTSGASSAATTGNTGSGTALDVVNPFLGINFIIRAVG